MKKGFLILTAFFLIVIPSIYAESEIEFNNSSANSVVIAGDWNDWAGSSKGSLDLNTHKMIKGEDGKWRYSLSDVSQGMHEYKYIIDGKWEEGPNRKINVTPALLSSKLLNQSPDILKLSSGTVFEIEAPSAGKVSVAGSFNDWNMNANFLQKDADGKWRTRLNLKPGTYEYKFLQDGDWDKLNKDNRKITVNAGAESALPLPALNSYSEPGTVFEIEAQSAGKVSVAGSFNDWNMNANFLQKDADGKWRTRL
ncbi:hypothetical protein KA977_01230, partial [Candidatus Dependentiae bacterium]|nr:hypothetical protein [Candidatus Dependentiae bacterium]